MLLNKIVAPKVITGITAFHIIEVFSFAVRSTGSSEESTGKVLVISLNGNESDDAKENKEG